MSKALEDTPRYHIVAPIFNEGNKLDIILNKIKSLGYLQKIIFVNDASTDNSKTILEKWEQLEGIEVIHLLFNRRKEGAILSALEKLARENRLPEKVIVMDSDSYLVPSAEENSLSDIITYAMAYMDRHRFAGMAFRMDPLLQSKTTSLQRAQYAEYVSTRFWHHLTSKQGKLWVINGPGGIFRSDVLLNILRRITYDFDTGDLLITVNLMKENYRIGYYADIKVQTVTPNTFKNLFKQRRRWTRGVLKVLVKESPFYLKQFISPSLLAFQVGVIFMTNFLFLVHLFTKPLSLFSLWRLFFLYLLTVSLSIFIILFDKGIRKDGERFKVAKWAFLQGLISIFVVIPANLVAFYDTFKYILLFQIPRLLREKLNTNIMGGI